MHIWTEAGWIKAVQNSATKQRTKVNKPKNRGERERDSYQEAVEEGVG